MVRQIDRHGERKEAGQAWNQTSLFSCKDGDCLPRAFVQNTPSAQVLPLTRAVVLCCSNLSGHAPEVSRAVASRLKHCQHQGFPGVQDPPRSLSSLPEGWLEFRSRRGRNLGRALVSQPVFLSQPWSLLLPSCCNHNPQSDTFNTLKL